MIPNRGPTVDTSSHVCYIVSNTVLHDELGQLKIGVKNMVSIPMISGGAVDRQSVLSINQKKIQKPLSAQTIASVNQRGSAQTAAAAPVSTPMPPLLHTVQKGQKIPLKTQGALNRLKVCLGWNTGNAACDIDVSAFLLNGLGKVTDDAWFVFYGQTKSPDGSTIFMTDQGADRECVAIDLTKLDAGVSRIVFVLTIHEALEKNLHFGMVRDAYVRIMDADSQKELVSFKMEEYYSNVISMMIGEIYRHNGQWKFNAIGNGVAKDLAGLCALYGVEVT